MAALCHNFTQNAWKKDLCSNCFKSKEEHNANGNVAAENKSRYLSTMYSSRAYSWRQKDTTLQSILKDGQQVRRTKTSAVHFAAEESEVIGFGGDECYSSDGEDGMENTSDGTGGSDDEAEGEEERALQKLTRSNTCFNTVSSNLLGNSDGKSTYSQLMLGKPLTDAEGKKQTLLVSVTPFGSAADDGPSRKKQTTKLGDFLSATKPAVKSAETPQELISKLSAANIDAMERKDKIGKVLPRQNSKDLLLKSLTKDNEEESAVNKSEEQLSEILSQENEAQCEVVKVNKVENAPTEPQSKQEADVTENKVSRIPVIKNRLSPDKNKTINRTPSGRIEQSTKGNESPPKPVARKSYEFVKKVDTSKKESTNIVPKIDSSIKAENQTPNKSETECSAKNDDKKVLNKVSESCTKGAERKLSIGEYTQQTRSTATKVVQEKLKTATKPSNIVVETHNLEIKNTKKSHSIESKNFVNSLLESEKKPFSLKIYNIDSVCIEKCSSTVEGSYKKLSLDDEPIKQETAKFVTEDTDVEMFRVEESRELAGEPDGRADPDDVSEPPALPRSPPPVIDPRPSFLHTLTQAAALRKTEKPKVPAKPSSKILQSTPRKMILKKEDEETPVCGDVPHTLDEPPQPETPAESLSSMTIIEGKEAEQDIIPQQDITTLPELARAHKRQAPKPPTPTEDAPPIIHIPLKEEVMHVPEPVSRRKEEVMHVPEPVSRRNVSLSAENLVAADVPTPTPEKKSSHSRARFSLRKFLRLGGKSSSKDDRGAAGETHKLEESLVSPRPRLEIIHPLDLNGTSVEVVHGDANNVRRSLEDSTSTSSGSSENKDGEILTDSSTSLTSNSPNNAARPNKPPPPPRNQSLDAWGKTLESLNKPARPPPPKSAELLRQQKQPTGRIQPTAPVSNLYANLALISGEVRSGLAPCKPQRSSSIRDANSDGPKRRAATDHQTEDSGYESVELSNGKPIIHNHEVDLSENVYECVTSACSSSPECDSVDAIALAKPARYAGQRRSEGSMDTSPDYLKFRGSFMRSTSLPYCGSETESDIYSPYSFYGSEDLQAGDDDSEWSVTSGHPWKISKLRLRKGRTIVHKNLEDNYGAVIVANHEALAQVLEQINAGVAIPPALRGLKAVTNLRWTDFILLDEARVVAVGRRAFHPALWGMHRVTLSVAPEQTSPSTLHCRGSLALSPVTEFTDLVPAWYLPGQSRSNTEPTQAWVSVLPRMQVDTIQSYGLWFQAKGLPDEERNKDGSFVLLQLINGLKHLQAQGLEEASLSYFALWRREEWEQVAPPPRLCILGTGAISEGTTTLCQCALTALQDLLPSTAPLVPLLKDLLRQERAGSLSRVKAVLEFSLWGPADIPLGTSRELVLQRWLDLERATVLHGLVRSRVELSAFEECHLLFLVRTSAKTMSEASLLLENNKVKPETTSF